MGRTALTVTLLAVLASATPCLPMVAGFPVIVVDDRGIEITVASRPERIIAVNALYAEILVDLGALDRLVAVANSPDNPDVTSGLASVGLAAAPNVELIVGLEPDLVLGASDWGGERPALEAAGITVLTTPWLGSVPDVFAAIESIAAAIGSDAEGAALIGRIAREIVDAEAQVLGVPKVTAAFLYAGAPGDLPFASGAEAIENEVILRAGGANVFADIESAQVSFESILEKDPDVIFTAPFQIANLIENPLLQEVSAIRDERVVGIRGSVIASTQGAEALRQMIEALHGIAP